MSVTVTVRVPPENVCVAPTTGPLVPFWIVTLCVSCELLVNWIKIVPGFAVYELLVNRSRPLGSATIVKAVLGCPGTLAGAVEFPAEVDVAGVPAVDVLLLEPPHAARPIAPMAIARVAVILGMLGRSFGLRQASN